MVYKETTKYGLFTVKKEKFIETIPEETQILDLLEKYLNNCLKYIKKDEGNHGQKKKTKENQENDV